MEFKSLRNIETSFICTKTYAIKSSKMTNIKIVILELMKTF